MKIAVIGPPGVGKTKLANALGKHYDFKVVDNYIQRFQKKTSLALGPWCSYSEHLMVAGLRMAAESAIPDDPEVDVIVVGTIIDTLTYAATKTDVVMHSGPEAARAAYDAARSGLQGLGLIYRETWDYHIGFHLGFSQEDRVKQPSWVQALDSAYPTVVESFEVPYIYGIEGDHANRLAITKEVIDLARNPIAESEAEGASGEAPRGTGGFEPPEPTEA